MGFRHLLHYGAPARQDIDQLAALQDQQGLADRTATHIQLTGDTQLLDTIASQHVTMNNLLGKMLGYLLREAFFGFEAHGHSLWGLSQPAGSLIEACRRRDQTVVLRPQAC